MRKILPSSLVAILLLWGSFCSAEINVPKEPVEPGEGTVLFMDKAYKEVVWTCYPSPSKVLDLHDGRAIFFAGVKPADYTIIAAAVDSEDKLTLQTAIIHVGGTTPVPVPVPPSPPEPTPIPVPPTPEETDIYGFSKAIPTIFFQKNGGKADAVTLSNLYRAYVKAITEDGITPMPTVKTTADALDLFKKITATSTAKPWKVAERYPELPPLIAGALHSQGLDVSKPLDRTTRVQLIQLFQAAAKGLDKVK